MSNLLKIGAFWVSTAKNNPDNKYLSGKIGDVRLLLFKTSKKTSDKSPDYELFLDPQTLVTTSLDEIIKKIQQDNKLVSKNNNKSDDIPF